MTLEECYREMGGNYQEVKKRLPSDKMIRKFLKMFKNDPSFFQLKTAIQERDGQNAFLAAHTLKGVCQNLGLDLLYEEAKDLSDHFRSGWSDEGAGRFIRSEPIYQKTLEAILRLEESA